MAAVLFALGTFPMRQASRIVVTTGPERGKSYELSEELVHIGRSNENQIVLDDPGLAEHHASILQRDGRFAIYRPDGANVEVDGAEIPSEKWVWLPNNSKLQFGRRTSCQFSYDLIADPQPQTATVKTETAKSEAAKSETESTGSVTLSEGVSVGTEAPKKKGEKKKKVKKHTARFITDQGDPLVELGADGQLPELALEDGPAAKERGSKSKETSPLVLYGVLAFSMLMSLGLLLIEPETNSRASLSKSQARREIVTFYGKESDELKPHQKALRAARLAHARGDRQTELAEYRRVVEELNAEDANRLLGVTGHQSTDEELRRLIGIIISSDDPE